MNKKVKSILGSILVIGVVTAMLGASTQSWLSDEEKSVGNFLVAGSLDLKVDLVNSTHYRHNGTLLEWKNFSEKNLGPRDKFFCWDDIKPGDYGEFTLSLHLYDNPSYLYFNISNILDIDNGINEPEDMVDGVKNGSDSTPTGDLDDYVFFWIWIDWGVIPGFGDDEESEGDNECQCSSGEPVITHGHLKDISPNGETWNLSKIMEMYGYPYGISGIMQPCVTYYIAIAWFIPGEDMKEGDYFEPFDYYLPEDIPGAGNIIQTDKWAADMTFYVEQI